ncbi:hypothetical protein B7H20_29205 [Pseudomonas aeruginosa]|uniref:TetR/AcrR family transcriptional regulator n=1 Tax=Pseudomonas psychrophila TaxID=122355 RepID=A0A8I1FVF6_9PSED|nr:MULTISPECIES: TetR/AcrR family transcriptional regulator [Pseudomonadaceae]MBJ2258918.1 TetR/AcrR family transcriptional regulator [Pseudomonas psychrophila]ORL54778.1 hypothetical protein B7H20_29205 [Pseudomonas aeruginosa]
MALGLREKHKLDKLKRIRTAARTLFLEKGFDGATTRKVAEMAGVSHATVFLYAKDKRDLLFLVFNDDLDRVAEEARGAVDPSASMLDQLTQLLGPFYRYFAQDSMIGLLGIHEYTTAVASDSPQMQRVKQRAESMLAGICSVIDACKASGTVVEAVDSSRATQVIRAIYMAEMDAWLRTPPLDCEAGVQSLRAALGLLFMGLRA